MRKAPTVGLETRSGMRASSIFNARIDRKASRLEGGINVLRVYDGESNFLQAILVPFLRMV
jgi:hypothetical protein